LVVKIVLPDLKVLLTGKEQLLHLFGLFYETLLC
jgi:hypothetical protein